jgi:hypothetical protein
MILFALKLVNIVFYCVIFNAVLSFSRLKVNLPLQIIWITLRLTHLIFSSSSLSALFPSLMTQSLFLRLVNSCTFLSMRITVQIGGTNTFLLVW